jgi:dTDP-4-amino-4,6-dideoxygalactose transaminase
MQIPLVDLKAQYQTIQQEIQEAINRVLESQYFILGPEVEALETEIADYCQVTHAVGVASGSDALLLSMMALDISTQDEVITSPYTFFATAGAISRVGATPIFVDIDPRTYNLNPALIERAITSRTKAIIPVHLYGQCADMEPILDIADTAGLYVVEDAAQAIGAEYRNKRAGSLGHLGCLSFFPSKNLGGYGDGGMVVTNSAALAEKVRVLRAHGAKPKYHHAVIGCNSRLDSLQASILRVKLKYLNQWNERRQEKAAIYERLFQGSGATTPYAASYNKHVYNQYIIRVDRRDELMAVLKQHGIGTAIYYPIPLHLQECYAELEYGEGDLPESEKAAKETLALPIYPELKRKQQESVVEIVNGIDYDYC